MKEDFSDNARVLYLMHLRGPVRSTRANRILMISSTKEFQSLSWTLRGGI